MASKEIEKKGSDFPIYGFWRWFFYVFGWITNVFNIFFWFVELIVYLISDDKNKYKNFHKVVMIFGVLAFISIIIFLLFFILGLSIITSAH
jgi:hypothetical protein